MLEATAPVAKCPQMFPLEPLGTPRETRGVPPSRSTAQARRILHPRLTGLTPPPPPAPAGGTTTLDYLPGLNSPPVPPHTPRPPGGVGGFGEACGHVRRPWSDWIGRSQIVRHQNERFQNGRSQIARFQIERARGSRLRESRLRD